MLMKVIYILLCSLLYKNVLAQNTQNYPQWQHPILQELRKESKTLVPFYNKDSTAFITISVIDTKQKAIYWFDCFGYYFDAVSIGDANIAAIKNKNITAFKYYDLITTEYLKTITKARINLQTNGSAALFTKYETQLLLINDSVKYPSSLKKLIELDKQKLSIERQMREFHSLSPRKLKEDTVFSKTLALQYGAMETSFKNGDSITTYYNRIALEPVYKAVLNHTNASIVYYNRGNQKIDSIQFEAEKVALLRNEKTDVFLLYRGWLEMNRYNIVKNIADIKTAINELAKQKTKIEKAQFANTTNSLSYLLEYSNKFLKTTDYKIDYLTTVDRGFVTQCLKQQYKQTKNTLTAGDAILSTFTRGNKFYELTDMRGNVMAVVTDKKIAHSANNITVDYYEPDVVAATDYAPFGMPLAGRNVQSDKYRYGYNGKENDKETTTQDYGMRIYDPRLGRFLSVDPITAEYPNLTPYQFASNRPIDGIDMDGLEYLTYTIVIAFDGNGGTRIMNTGYNWYNDNQHNAHGKKGRGVQYEIKYYSEQSKKFIGGYSHFTSRNAGLVWGKVMKEYGNYMGATGLKEFDKKGDITNTDSYNLPPVDIVDMGAYLHDKGYDALNAKGANSLFGDWGTTPVDETALNGWNSFLANYKVGSSDPLNNQPVSQTERNAAYQGASLFELVVGKKKLGITQFMQENYKEANQGTKILGRRIFNTEQVEANYNLFLSLYMEKNSDGNWIRKAGMWSEDKNHNFTPIEPTK